MTTQLDIPANALFEKDVQPFTALCFTTTATLRTLSEQVNVAEKMYQEAARLGLNIAGPIQWIYTGATGDENKEFQLEIALPVSQPGEPAKGFSYKVFPAFQCVSYTYTGPWSDFGAVYDVLFQQLRQTNYEYDGRVREIYAVVDFANQANCVTEIQIGIH